MVNLTADMIQHVASLLIRLKLPPMVNLTADMIQHGAVIAFWGSADISEAIRTGHLQHIPGRGLSSIIEHITGDKELPLAPSHIGTLPKCKVVGQPIVLFHSSIFQGISGPQLSNLSDVLVEYQGGGHVAVYPFLPQFEPDWTDYWEYVEQLVTLQQQGKLPYAWQHLVGDLFDRAKVLRTALDLITPVPLGSLIRKTAYAASGMVCSECAEGAMSASGVRTKARAAGIDWCPKTGGRGLGCAPGELIPPDLSIYGPPIQVLP